MAVERNEDPHCFDIKTTPFFLLFVFTFFIYVGHYYNSSAGFNEKATVFFKLRMMDIFVMTYTQTHEFVSNFPQYQLCKRNQERKMILMA